MRTFLLYVLVFESSILISFALPGIVRPVGVAMLRVLGVM